MSYLTWFITWNALNVGFTMLGLWMIWPWFSTSPDLIACQAVGIGAALLGILASSGITYAIGALGDC